jgi:beta-alanine--pyruvate transaminase
MVTVAKGITNGTVPMGAVFVRQGIYDAFMEASSENAIEFFHGYTYSGHPLACAAAMATLDVYEEEGLFAHAHHLASYWEDCVHSLRGLPHVIDLRNLGLVAAIELEPIPGKPGVRAMDCLQRCYDKGLLIRTTADIIALSPPLIVQKNHIEQMVEILAGVLRELP